MDEKLLGRAVEYHGPDFLRQLQLEQEKVPSNIFLHLQKHRPQPPEINDQQFILNVRRFISKKADILFRPTEQFDREIPDQTADEDSFAKMPALETFMGIDPHTSRKHLYISFEVKDIVIAVVTSILDTGLVLQLLCLDNGKNRDIDDLRVSAFVPSKEIPQMFPTQNPVEGYQIKDYIRGVVVTVNPDNETILLSLKETALKDPIKYKPTLGLIHEEDFPVQYRRKLHIRGLTFDELVNSILGFSNPGNVPFLMDTLQQKHDVSLMRGLNGLKISEKDYADNLRKSQSQKWAYQCVAQGIHDFKKGLQTEAMQSFNKALQIDKTNVEALVARGALYANNESYSKALTDFEEALSHNRKHPNAIKYMHETLLAKGKCHEDDKQYPDAKKCYQRAIEIMPDSSEAKEYLRYVEYKEEHATGEKERKPVVKRERSPSPLPFKETTDKLKQLIQEDKKTLKSKSSKSGEIDLVEDKHRRGRSQSPRRRKRRQSSSSSSSSSSRSRSPKGRRSTSGKSPSREVYVKKEVDKYGSSKTRHQRSRSKDKYGKSRSSDKRSRSPDRYELNKNEDLPSSYKMEKEHSGYAKGRNTSDMSAVYSFSRNNEKIPGLGESPPEEDEPDTKHDDVSQYMKHDDPSASKFSDDKAQPRETYNEGPSSRRPDPQRSPSWGREGSAVYSSAGNEKGDVRRRRKSDVTRDEEKRQYERMLDEELYGKSDRHVKNKSRSPEQRNRMSSRDRLIQVERHESVTPTKDEVSDRLGLEDISSPEDQFRQSDYRLRAYGSHEEYERQKYDRRAEKYRSKDDAVHERGRRGRYSPDVRRRHSPDSRDGSPRQRPDEDHVERRIISVSKKEKKPAKQYEPDFDNYVRKEDAARRRSPDVYDADDVSERRNIVIGGRKEKKVKRKSSSSSEDSDDYIKERARKDDRKRDKARRSRTPESKHRFDDKRKRAQKDDRESRSRSRSPRRVSRHSRSPKRESYRSRSKSPSIRKNKDKRSETGYDDDEEDTKIQRVISVKPKKMDTKGELKSPQDTREISQRSKDKELERLPLRTDIFADLPPPKAHKDSLAKKFATYVPRAVKLKQQHPVGINPERHLSVTEERVESKEVRGVHVKSIEDIQRNVQDLTQTRYDESSQKKSKLRTKDNSRSRSRSRDRRKRSHSPDESHKSRKNRKSRSRSHHGSRSRHRSRSRRRSRSRHRSRSAHKSRSRSRSRSKRRSRSRHRSQSKSRDRRRSEKDSYKKRRHSSSSSSPPSKSRNRVSSSKYGIKKEQKPTSPKVIRNIEVDLPKISSRWDSPEEKKSRWGGLNSDPVLMTEASVSLAKEKMANILAANLMSSSPPPHRSMKPAEKEALRKKWKELSASPLEESDDDLPAVIKQRIAMVEKKILFGKDDSSKKEMANESDSVSKRTDKIVVKNSEKAKKLKGVKSKWDTDSDNSGSSRSRSRSLDRKPLSNNKKQDGIKRADSKDKKKSADGKSSKKKKRSRSRSRSRDRGRTSGKRNKSRSRSRSRRRSRSKDRKYSSIRRRRSESKEKRSSEQKSRSFSEKKSKQENGKGLPDVVSSTKSSSSDKYKNKRNSRDDKSRSRSPRSKSSKALFKSKWSSDSDSEAEKKEAKKAVEIVPKDSLNEMEKFYLQLKNDQKRKMNQK